MPEDDFHNLTRAGLVGHTPVAARPPPRHACAASRAPGLGGLLSTLSRTYDPTHPAHHLGGVERYLAGLGHGLFRVRPGGSFASVPQASSNCFWMRSTASRKSAPLKSASFSRA